jgi:DsbC/DsbD-like thiol-disulfide interchange protein
MRIRFIPVIVAMLAAALPQGAPRADEAVPDDLVRAEVIGGWTMPDGTRIAALRLTLAEGWKTYWRAPGEAGIPPRFDWKGSRNLRAVAFHWPVPKVFEVNGFRVIGYDHELVLPFTVTPAMPGDPVTVAAEVELGICHDVCVPVTVDVRADLPDVTTPDPDIRAALSRLPQAGPKAGLTSATCAVEPLRDGLRLTATLAIPSPGDGEFVVIETADPSVWVSPPTLTRSGGRVTAVADLVPSTAEPFALDRSGVRMTLFGGGRAVQIDGCTG